MTRRLLLGAVILLLAVLALIWFVQLSDPVNRIAPGMTKDEVDSLLGPEYSWVGRELGPTPGLAYFGWHRPGKRVWVTFEQRDQEGGRFKILTTGEVEVFTWGSPRDHFWALFGYPIPQPWRE